MKAFKKMSTSIAMIITTVTIVCVLILFVISNSNMTAAMRSTAENNIITSLDSKTQIIDEYISSAETSLYAFSQSGEIKDFLKDPTNETKKAVAQAYTEKYHEALGNWEGIYLCSWESEVLTHSNAGAVGMIMREGDSLKSLQDSITAAGHGVFNTGILVSPASGNQVIAMYAPVFDGEEIIGFVGGATLAQGMKDILDAAKIAGLENAEYSLINLNKGVYIFDKDETLINTEVEKEPLLAIMEEAKSGVEKNTVEYQEDGQSYFSVYKMLGNRGWLLVIRDTETEIFGLVKSSQIILGIVCLITIILIAAISYIFIGIKINPLTRVTKAIDKLEKLDLQQDEKLEKYAARKDEVGQIAKALISLGETFRNIVETLDNCSASLTVSSDTMGDVSRELMSSVESDSATTEELSAGIINTNESISNMTSEVSRMKDMANHIETCVQKSNSDSEDLTRAAKDMNAMANESMESSVEKIAQTREKVEEAISELQALNKINDMATQILDITSQTNLLSLNASIEAARAGESGRGFAVVADEIGKLAKDSSETVSQIQGICEAANKSIEKVRDCFSDIMGFLETDMAQKFASFADISKGYEKVVAQIKDSIDTIEETTSEFVESVSNIMEQVDTISAASTDNEQGVEELIHKNDETVSHVDQVVTSARENKENAEKLSEIINRFTNIRNNI
ncbi:MAG: methyl-accepting chemotaxis protein [Lachnospiraceae bacterium]